MKCSKIGALHVGKKKKKTEHAYTDLFPGTSCQKTENSNGNNVEMFYTIWHP